MKKLAYYLLFVGVLGFSACSDDTTEDPVVQEDRVTLDVDSESGIFLTDESGDKASIRFKSAGGEVVIGVTTNQDEWKFTNSNPDWLETSSDGHFLTLKADRNTSATSPSATIVISAGTENTQKSYTLEVSQNYYGQPEVTLSSNKVHMPAYGVLSQEITLDTNQDEWSVESNCSWLLLEKSDNTLTLTVDPNKSTLLRETEIRVRVGYGDQSAAERVVINQDGTAYIKANTYNATCSGDGTTEVISITANPELEWVYETPQSDWYTVVRKDNDLEVTIQPNSGNLERRSTIDLTVGSDANVATAKLNIIQIGEDTKSFIAEYTVSAGGTLYPGLYGSISGNTLYAAGADVTVDWGDGSAVESFKDEYVKHTYTDEGLYTVTVTGTAPVLKLPADNVLKVVAWGNMGTTYVKSMCASCQLLEYVPDDTAGAFAEVTDFSSAFTNAWALKAIPAKLFQYGQKITSLSETFEYCGSVTALPAHLLDNCTSLTTLDRTFYSLGVGNLILQGGTVAEGHIIDISEGFFDNCPQITTFTNCFRAINFGKFPAKLFANLPKVTSFNSFFMECNFNEDLPSDLFENNPDVTDFYNLFRCASGMKHVPAGIFKNNAKATRLNGMFQGSDIEVVHAGLFEGLPANATITNLFAGCGNITTIEEGALDAFSATTSIAYLFAGPQLGDSGKEWIAPLTKLKSVPAGLFSKLTAVTNCSYLFQNSGLESVPEGLFSAQTKCTNYTRCFQGCTALTSIPADLFYGTTAAVNFQYCFMGCSNLKSVPAGLFDKFTGVTTGFNYLFQDCVKLEEIPATLFQKNTKTTGFVSTFQGCASLKEIPEDLFRYVETSTRLTTFQTTFAACTSLTTIPEDLFRYNTKVTTFNGTFNGCTSLTTIPEGLLTYNTALTSVTSMFLGCTSLKEIPAGLFDGRTKITNFSNTFKGCTGLTGESPYTVVNGVKVHLYERADNTSTFSKPSNTTSCFLDCTQLSDYDDIPTGWK